MALNLRIPLVPNTVAAVVHRLDVVATRAVDPPGAGTSGVDDLLDDVVVYTDAGTGLRTSARREVAAVRVPCQLETLSHDRLRETFGGDAPTSTMVLVFHRRDLASLGLLDATNRACLVRVNDRVSAIERVGSPGTVVMPLGPENLGLFVYEVRAGSWGLGPDGHDLELVYMNDRPRAAVG